MSMTRRLTPAGRTHARPIWIAAEFARARSPDIAARARHIHALRIVVVEVVL